ncbi:SAM-dependent methyltransferase [Streptomyces sp. AHU1]|uniref:SAM-dependent methyltransferase n=1 Tax=Streptomyces sp. AHU1 TaxID=3377215 RepID=UPI003877D786
MAARTYGDRHDLTALDRNRHEQTASRAEFSRFFGGLDLVEPGVAVVHEWPPEPGEPVRGQGDGGIPDAGR